MKAKKAKDKAEGISEVPEPPADMKLELGTNPSLAQVQMDLPNSLNELIKLGFSAQNLVQVGRKSTFDAEDYMQLKMFT